MSLSGTLGITKVTIAPAAVASAGGDVSMLEDLVAVAVNDALKQYQKRFGSSPDDQIQKMLACSDIGEKSLQSRALHRTAGYPAIVVLVLDQ